MTTPGWRIRDSRAGAREAVVIQTTHPLDRRIERVGDRLLEGEEAVSHVIERIVAPLGLRVDGSSPWVDARLPDGSRVHAIVPPLSLCGPVLNVRKPAAVAMTPEDLVTIGTLGPNMVAFLAACVRGRANMVISGGTSSGKTTLLGVLSSFVPDDERIVTIEDAAELRLAKPHVIGLEARPANVEGRGEVTVRDLRGRGVPNPGRGVPAGGAPSETDGHRVHIGSSEWKGDR